MRGIREKTRAKRDFLKEQERYSSLKNIETEKFVKVPLKDNINFVGFIDKIVYDTIGDITIASIIDYKTYVKKPSLKYIESGIGLQLPTYMYLSEYSFKNIRFAGFYLQNITLDNKSDEDKRKIESELSDLLMIDCDIDLFKITFEDIEKCESLTTKEFMLLEVLLDK